MVYLSLVLFVVNFDGVHITMRSTAYDRFQVRERASEKQRSAHSYIST